MNNIKENVSELVIITEVNKEVSSRRVPWKEMAKVKSIYSQAIIRRMYMVSSLL